MQRTTLPGTILLVLFCFGLALFASEFDELRERAKGKREAAGKLAPNGNSEKAQDLNNRLFSLVIKERKLREAAAPEKELAEICEQILGAKRELRQVEQATEQNELPPLLRAQAEKLETATRRIYHLRAAAHNLKIAEEHELAQKLIEKVEAMEQMLRESKVKAAAEGSS